MPNIRSAEKRARQSRRRRDRNRHERSRLRTAIKKVRQAGGTDEARAAMTAAESLLDRLASKGVIHANAAARHKARLYAHIARLSDR